MRVQVPPGTPHLEESHSGLVRTLGERVYSQEYRGFKSHLLRFQMKILLIDNGTSYLPELKKLLSGHTFKIIKYSEISSIQADTFDATILSGGHNFPVKNNENRLKNEFAYVTNSKKPILGICFGFEIIARAFGAELELMPRREQGLLDIQVDNPEVIFSGISTFQVFENHRWVVKKLPESLVALAHSKDGIEALKHHRLPIYGVQFHPEMFTEKTNGIKILSNFLRFG